MWHISNPVTQHPTLNYPPFIYNTWNSWWNLIKAHLTAASRLLPASDNSYTYMALYPQCFSLWALSPTNQLIEWMEIKVIIVSSKKIAVWKGWVNMLLLSLPIAVGLLNNGCIQYLDRITMLLQKLKKNNVISNADQQKNYFYLS